MATLNTTEQPTIDSSFLERFFAGKVSEEEALEFAQQAPELVSLTVLEIQRRIASKPATGANQSSSTIPPHGKKNTAGNTNNNRGKGSKKKNKGGQNGSSRPTPASTAAESSKTPATHAIESAQTFPKTSSRSSPKM